MKFFKYNLFLLNIFFFFFVFILFSSSEKMLDIGSLPISEKRLAFNLIQIYNETKDAQNNFYVNFQNTQKMFNEIKKENNNNNNSSLPSFLQIKSKGPVEEETIWRALYDTQLRRSPPTEEVHVYSTEDIEKEYEQAKLDAFKSQIDIMKNQFEKNLQYMSKELSRQKNIKDVLNQIPLLEEEINKVQKKKPYKNGPIKKIYSTKIQC
ncbi:conserved Plasmodium protein, unknown function [Plasmodium gallinaceum]|uniref:Uncharacterized protein n=1 Tax=Plasmodium gallinaceum TaxID=5849 RepID=A0A1J1GQN6_PLAGA|nr:conserved Plasmodium protein, unknown function [Plasmodium gallinaceum]CRG93354.1 conserved Plasmodium protein, unknown function [Plasmodium gallinaceum]